MELEGIVTNVANFGAFVDVGVHQDGLVHISQLADRFVKDPKAIVQVGQVVKVRVMEVNEALKRISLSMKAAGGNPGAASSAKAQAKSQKPQAQKPQIKLQTGGQAKSQTRKQAKVKSQSQQSSLEDLKAKFNRKRL